MSEIYDVRDLVENYGKKWADTKQALAAGIAPPSYESAPPSQFDQLKQFETIGQDFDVPAVLELAHQQRHADTEHAIRQLNEVMEQVMEVPAIKIIRGANGRASAIDKGGQILIVHRGPDGRATGLSPKN